MGAPSISILLPTWNGEAFLRRLLPALERQRTESAPELLAIDSSSEDGTVALLREAGAQVRVIERSEFGHGRTRNELARWARGEYLVFLSQDALPADEEFLAELTAPFSDPRVAGVYSRILPHPEDDPLTARTVLAAPEASEEELVRDLDGKGSLGELEPTERAEYLRFNNVASAVRRAVAEEIPFPELPFGEDFAWAARALSAGHRIVFAPRSVAFHAHAFSLRQAFERYRIDAAFHREIHGLRLRPDPLSVIRGILYEVGQDWRFLRRRERGRTVRSLLRSPALRGAQILGQFCGSRGLGAEFWPEGGGIGGSER